MTLAFRPLHAELGVEITGCKLAEPLSEDDFGLIRQALADHGVVAMPGQHLSAAQQLEFLRRFGVPKISQRKEFHVPDVPEIGRVGNTRHADGTPSAFLDREGNLWHTDTASDHHIDAVTMLSCVQAPEQGGDTLFCSMYSAWERLPAKQQAALDGLDVVHNFNQHNDYLLARNPGSAKPLSAQDRARWEDRVHELVQVHPRSGRTLYFVSPTLVKTIGELSPKASRQLADDLVAHATAPGHVLSYHWRPGDLVFWDNRAVMHSASPANYGGSERLMHRGYAYMDMPQTERKNAEAA